MEFTKFRTPILLASCLQGTLIHRVKHRGYSHDFVRYSVKLHRTSNGRRRNSDQAQPVRLPVDQPANLTSRGSKHLKHSVEPHIRSYAHLENIVNNQIAGRIQLKTKPRAERGIIFYNQNFFYIRINCLSEASGLCLLRKSAVHLIQSQRADHAHRKAEYIRGKGDA